MFLKKSLQFIFLLLTLSSKALADDFSFSDLIGARGLSIFELEMRGTFLLPFCRHDTETKVVSDSFQCLNNNGRPLKPDQREIMLAIPGTNLRNGYFSRFEKETLESLDFENELARTPSGKKLLKIYNEASNKKNIRLKIFYHVERSKNLFSNMLTRERLEQQHQTHFGFTVSKDNRALIGINAYQNQNEVFYTLLHEFYHLFDPEIVENPSAKDQFLQELRALLFELRIYIERQQLIPKDKYSISHFHRQFLLKDANGELGVNWTLLSHYIHTRFFPELRQDQFIFSSAKETNFLHLNREMKAIDGGLPFNEVLLAFFDEELKKSNLEQDDDTIVARLLYALPTQKRIEDSKKYSDIVKRMYNGFGKMFSEDYKYLIDLTKEVSLRTDRINNITTGGPRPREGGGQ